MLTSAIFSALSAELPPGVPLYLGRRHLSEHDVPPRLVLVPTTDSYSWPERKSGDHGRPLFTRQAGYELIVWGRDIDETERAVGDVLAALYRVIGASLRLEGGSWSEDQWLTMGYAYTLQFAIASPVSSNERYAALESIAQSCGGFVQ